MYQFSRCNVCPTLQVKRRFFAKDVSNKLNLNRHSKPNLPIADESLESVAKIRNIGLIAHIDAGKTTTTERMLFYSGLSNVMGEVHTGDTITDYLVQERERGITITSAAVSFPWKRHKINLLDTPGHVDFTIEVERCLSVLDSTVVILDSVGGVEAQTQTVWRQAERFQIPKIVYINKMDKATANIEKCISSLEKLDCNPLITQLPITKNEKFVGIIDFPSFQAFEWNTDPFKQGIEFQARKLTPKDESYEVSIQKREELVGMLAENDAQFGDLVLQIADISNLETSDIVNSLRRCVIRNLIVPVLFGSSYKNVAVQLLLDAILRYLPSPLEKPSPIVQYYGKNFCAAVFKVIHHKNLGALTFIRIYSGQISTKDTVYNIQRDVVERITKIYIPLADHFQEIGHSSFGNIVAVAGLNYSVTSDTLTFSKAIANEARAKYAKENCLSIEESSPVLASIKIPEPVFFCTIEAPSSGKQKELDIALANLQREDPSLQVTVDETSGQTILSGMGELHLEIIRDRIHQEHGVDASLGTLRVSYREVPKDTLEGELTSKRAVGGINNYVSIKLKLHPVENWEEKFKLKVVVTQENDLGKLRNDRLRAIKEGVRMALNFGPLANFPVYNVNVDLLEFSCSGSTLESYISSVTSECVAQTLKKGGMVLMEPVMKLEITCIEQYQSRVISDIINRRGELLNLQVFKDYQLITALAPLSELIAYSTTLRTITSGTSFFSMHLNSYRKMSETEQAKTLEKIFSI